LTPFHNYKQFDAETVRLMTEAYDAVLLWLEAMAEDKSREDAAAIIAKLVGDGERDPAILCELTLRQWHLWPPRTIVASDKGPASGRS
jgi:hypothetical protein